MEKTNLIVISQKQKQFQRKFFSVSLDFAKMERK